MTSCPLDNTALISSGHPAHSVYPALTGGAT